MKNIEIHFSSHIKYCFQSLINQKILFTSLLLFISFFSYGQVIIEMEENNGVYKIPCSVNGAKMKFIFDTGASSVSISEAIADYLLDNDYIRITDFVGQGKSTVADGRIVDNLIVILKDIEIAGLHLENIEAVVIEGQNTPLLLGQNVIKRLGRIEISGNKLKIFKAESLLTDSKIKSLFDEANKYYVNEMYSSSVECFKILYDADLLADSGKYRYGSALMYSNNYEKALEVILSISSYQYFLDINFNIYYEIAFLCSYTGKFKDAIPYYEKAVIHFDNSLSKLVSIYRSWGNNYTYLENYFKAIETYELALDANAKLLGVDREYLIRDCMYRLSKNQKSVKNDDSDYLWFSWLECRKNAKLLIFEDFYRSVLDLAVKGNIYAKRYCDTHYIDYRYQYDLMRELF